MLVRERGAIPEGFSGKMTFCITNEKHDQKSSLDTNILKDSHY